MANITDLSWKVTKNKNWIRVSPTAGTGNQSVTVQVTQAECYGETDLTGVITFTCNECPEGQKTRTISVKRCAPIDCGEPVISKSYGKVTGEANKCDTSKTVSVPFTSTSSYTVCGCASESSTGSESVTVTFDKNETHSQIQHYFDYEGQETTSSNYNIKIIQEAGPCTCQCDGFSVSPTSFTWNWNEKGTEKQSASTITLVSDCLTISERDITIDASNHFDLSWDFSSSTKKIFAYPKNSNTSTTENRTATITITARGGDSVTCEKTIKLKQNKCTNICDTKDIKIEGPTSGPCEGGSVTFTATTTINS